MVNCAGTMGTARIGEWMWRFLAGVMAFAVGWSIWIFYQLNPPALITDAAFEAAAKAKSKGRQNTQGAISPAASSPAEAVAASAPAEARVQAPASVPVAAAAPKAPPVNIDKLRLSDTLTAPAKK